MLEDVKLGLSNRIYENDQIRHSPIGGPPAARGRADSVMTGKSVMEKAGA